MSAQDLTTKPLGEAFRASMRLCVASVSLVTACDEAGEWHGMAVTSSGSLSMDPPSMMVAVNRTASIHPVIMRTGRFTLNLMGEPHLGLLERFSRSDMRHERFTTEDWSRGADGGPVLRGALATHVCMVAETHDFGTHTVFFGRVEEVVLTENLAQAPAPIIWVNGAQALFSVSRTV
jgi:flavin reductase (DIM6/NTAB) family NADH-FMN oxidoreductase RutF